MNPADIPQRLSEEELKGLVGEELWTKHFEKIFNEGKSEEDGKIGQAPLMGAARNIKEIQGFLAEAMKKMAETAGKYEAPKAVETKFYTDLLKALPDQAGKTFAITGCTSGTGAVLAAGLVSKGANVIMLNRPSTRAKAAHEKLQAAAAKPEQVVHIDCDLQNFESVRAAGKAIVALGVALDGLINNAGVMAVEDKATVDGYDLQAQTNHLSHFLLTSLVMPALQKAAAANGQARVVQHSSGARKGPPLEAKYFEKNGGNLGGDAPGEDGAAFSGPRWVRYHQSKLANLTFALGLRDQIAAAG